MEGIRLGIETRSCRLLKGRNPRQYTGVAQAISEGRGAVISEYPEGTRSHANNFPGRNRTINGLSRGVVVQAGNKSGAHIPADYAAEEGRIFAVPGRLGGARSSGTLVLLKQGVILLENEADVLNEFAWSGTPTAAQKFDLGPTEKLLITHLLRSWTRRYLMISLQILSATPHFYRHSLARANECLKDLQAVATQRYIRQANGVGISHLDEYMLNQNVPYVLDSLLAAG